MSDPYWYEKEIESLRTEIERLRAALEKIAKFNAFPHLECVAGMREIAIKVLKP